MIEKSNSSFFSKSIYFNSFLAAGGEKEQHHLRGIFDDNILSHTVGEVLIFESVRDYIREKQSINQINDVGVKWYWVRRTDSGNKGVKRKRIWIMK